MQIASLIGNDQIASRHNLHAPMDDFVERMEDFPNFSRVDEEWHDGVYSQRINSNWSRQHEANWTRVLHKTGFCYTFNYPNASQMFHQDK
jgi:hypothetical protein